MSIDYFWSDVSFKASVSLLIFCLIDLSIDVSGMLKCHTIIVLLSISSFMFVNICFMYLGAPMLGAYIYMYFGCVAVRGLSLVVASGGYSSLQCVGFSLLWLLLLQSTGSRCMGFGSCGTQAQ